MPVSCDYVTLQGKRDFADKMKVMDFKENTLDYPGEPNVIT